MKWYRDGDSICVTLDTFIDLQQSPAVFVPLASDVGRRLSAGGLANLNEDELADLESQLTSVPVDEVKRRNTNNAMWDALQRLARGT